MGSPRSTMLSKAHHPVSFSSCAVGLRCTLLDFTAEKCEAFLQIQSQSWLTLCVRVCVRACVHTFVRLSLFVTPWTAARQAPLSMGFSRQEYWSGLPFPPPGHRPNTGVEPKSPASAGGFFTISAIWKAPYCGTPVQNIDALLTWEQIPVIESARFYHSNSLNTVNWLERTKTIRRNLKRHSRWWWLRDEMSVVDSCIKGWTTEVMEWVSRWRGAPWSDSKFWSEAVRTGGRDLTGSWQSYKGHPRKRWASQVAQLVKNPPAMQETLGWFLGQEGPLEEG